MPNKNTNIRFKRSSNESLDAFSEEVLNFGEPLFLESDSLRFLILGKETKGSGEDITDNSTVPNSIFFKGFTQSQLQNLNFVFVDKNNNIVDENGEQTTIANNIAVKSISDSDLSSTDTTKYYLTTQSIDNEDLYKFDITNGVYISANGVLNGGAWNDYAERRICKQGKAGQVVCENGDGTLSPSSKILQALPYVISDTAGMIIGEETKDTKPLAVCGRVLVYVNCEVKVGDVLCADEGGYATVMTRKEVMFYPDRILGTVCEVPTYDTWNDVNVDSRVWVKIK